MLYQIGGADTCPPHAALYSSIRKGPHLSDPTLLLVRAQRRPSPPCYQIYQLAVIFAPHIRYLREQAIVVPSARISHKRTVRTATN